MTTENTAQPRVCAVCGKPLPTRRGVTRCCSRECGRAWQKEKNKRAYAALCASRRVCRICGKEFVGAGVGGYCSSGCRREQMHRAAVARFGEGQAMSCPWAAGTISEDLRGVSPAWGF